MSQQYAAYYLTTDRRMEDTKQIFFWKDIPNKIKNKANLHHE